MHARVRAAVHRSAMDVVAMQRILKDQHANVGDRTQVDKLSDGVLDEPLIDERVEEPLHGRYKHNVSPCYVDAIVELPVRFNNNNSIYLYSAISPELKFCSEELLQRKRKHFSVIFL